MKRTARLHLVAVALCTGTLGAATASAQSPASAPRPTPVEVWGAVSPLTWTSVGTLDTRYPPTVTSAPDATGRVGQSLTLDPANGVGFEVGLNLFPSRHAGLQTFVSRVACNVAGANTPFEVELQYTSRPPPSSQPVPVAVAWAVPWPDTTGRLQQWTLGAGPAVRWHASAVSVVVSGGLAWVRLRGEAEPLGHAVLWLGGHSVLFSDTIRARVALGPSTVVAGYATGALDLALGPHAAVTAGLRVLLAGDALVTARVDAIVDTGRGVSAATVAEIDQTTSPDPARLSPRGVAVFAGIKIR